MSCNADHYFPGLRFRWLAHTIHWVTPQNASQGSQQCYASGRSCLLTPYASGPSAIYCGSGYISRLDFWRLGAIFGLIFLAALMLVGVPYLNWFLSLTQASAMLIAPVGHRAAHSPQPLQRSMSCNTVLFFQAFVSKASRRNSQAEMQRPHPVQRAGSM